MTFNSTASISVASSDVNAGTWHRRLGHMSEKGMKAMFSKGKLLRFKSINLNSVKIVSTRSRERSVSRR